MLPGTSGDQGELLILKADPATIAARTEKPSEEDWLVGLATCIGTMNLHRRAGFRACRFMGHLSRVLLSGDWKSPKPTDRNLCPTHPRFHGMRRKSAALGQDA